MRIYPNFTEAVRKARQTLIDVGQWVHGDQWQSIDVSKKPEMVMRETLNFSFQVAVMGDLESLRADIHPNLPWADAHFLERVGGSPLNPGEEWANWPWGNSADGFRDANGQFSHTYMERFWPRYAGRTKKGIVDGLGKLPTENKGIRYRYGDLNDLISHMLHHPLSRQAYLPIWFPEDTGTHHRGRVPCTIGYHFIMRENYLHTVYQIRSCDVVRHFQDDIYLAVRLKLHLLKSLAVLDKQWEKVKPGFFTMHITSLHCFKNDYQQHVKEGKWV
jgi:hypothetical protein